MSLNIFWDILWQKYLGSSCSSHWNHHHCHEKSGIGKSTKQNPFTSTTEHSFYHLKEWIQTEDSNYLNRTITAFIRKPCCFIIAVFYYKRFDIGAFPSWIRATHALRSNSGYVLDIWQINLQKIMIDITCITAPCTIFIIKSCLECRPLTVVWA